MRYSQKSLNNAADNTVFYVCRTIEGGSEYPHKTKVSGSGKKHKRKMGNAGVNCSRSPEESLSQNSPSEGKLTSSHHSSPPTTKSERSSKSQLPDINEEYVDVKATDVAGVNQPSCSYSFHGKPTVKLTDSIPVAVRRDFISQETHRVMLEHPEAARNGRKKYKSMMKEGKVKMYKQKVTGMDIETLKKFLSTVKQEFNLDTFPLFKELTECIISDEWSQDKPITERIEMSLNSLECLLYNLQCDESKEKYNLALCHIIISDSTINDSVVVGGLLSEGLLAKDEKENVYLQF